MARNTARASGIITGTVVRVTAEGPIVELPRIAPGYEEGPLLTMVKGLAKGDKVALSALAHDPDTLIVLGLTGGDHKHDGADVTTGTVPIARLPVAGSGVSSSTAVVRANDSRLNDSRTPTAHQHNAADTNAGIFALARLPVAASGVSSASQVVRADDSRLSDSRAPGAHTHNAGSDLVGTLNNNNLSARLQTTTVGTNPTDWDTVVDSGWYRAQNAANAPTVDWWLVRVIAHSAAWVIQEGYQFTSAGLIDGTNSSHFRRVRRDSVWSPWSRLRDSEAELDTRYARTETAAQIGPTAEFIRVARIDGAGLSQGGAVTLIASGQGSIGSARRASTIVHAGERGGTAWVDSYSFGSTTTPWVWYRRQVSTYVWDLWAQRPSYDSAVNVTLLDKHTGTSGLLVDSQSTTNPGSLVALTAPEKIGQSLPLSMVSGAVGPFTPSLPADNVNRIGHFYSSVAVPAGAVTATVTLSWHAHSTGTVTALTWIPYIRRVGQGDIGIGGGRPVANMGIPAMDLGITVTGAVDVRGVSTLELHTAAQNPASSTAAVTIGTMNYSVTFAS